MLQVRIWRFVALKQGCSVSLLYFLHGYQTVMQQQYSHTAGNSFDHFENKEKTDVYVCVRVYLCRLSIWIQAYAVCGFEYQKVFAYGQNQSSMPGLVQDAAHSNKPRAFRVFLVLIHSYCSKNRLYTIFHASNNSELELSEWSPKTELNERLTLQ